MPTDLSFFQTPSPKPSLRVQRIRTEPCAPVQSSRFDVKTDTRANGHENFLSTLKKISQKQNPTPKSHQTDSFSSSKSEAFDSAAKCDETAGPASCHHNHNPEVDSHWSNKTTERDVDRIISDKFLAFINAFGNIGLHDWSRGTDACPKNEVVGTTKTSDALPASDGLGVGSQQSGVESSTNVVAKLERLRQMIAKTLAGIVASPAFGDLADGLGLNQLMESSDFEQLIKGIYTGKTISGGSASPIFSDSADSLGLNQLMESSDFEQFIKSIYAGKTVSGGAFSSIFGDSADGLGLSQLMKSSDFEQFIKSIYAAKAFAGSDSSPAIVDSGNGLIPNQLMEPSDFDQLIKSYLGGEDGLKRGTGFHTGESYAAEKTLAAISALLRLDSELAAEIKAFVSTKAAENPEILSQIQNREKLAAVPLAGENQMVEGQRSDHGRKAASIDLASMNISGGEDESHDTYKSRGDYWANIGSRTSGSSEHRQSYSSESASEKLPINESSPVSKMIEDAQVAKDKQIKMSASASEESSGKISKVDISTSDNGLLNSQSQSADKAWATTFLSKETEADQSALRSQTMDQIVRKAVIHLRNGQHEAKIDLKPEFLGHIRMQVITENQQVTVKILAELPFVKDMIENNVHQLKADLQQQGLTVDKLEVSVSHDSEENRHSKDNAEWLNIRQRGEAIKDTDNSDEKIIEQSGQSKIAAASTSTVDYFA